MRFPLFLSKVAHRYRASLNRSQQSGEAPREQIGGSGSAAQHQHDLGGDVAAIAALGARTVTEWRSLSAAVPVLGSMTWCSRRPPRCHWRPPMLLVASAPSPRRTTARSRSGVERILDGNRPRLATDRPDYTQIATGVHQHGTEWRQRARHVIDRPPLRDAAEVEGQIEGSETEWAASSSRTRRQEPNVGVGRDEPPQRRRS